MTEQEKEIEEEIIEEGKQKIKDIFLKRSFALSLIFIIILLFLAWQIRTANVNRLKDLTTGDYTLGPDLDPFLFLRYAKYIVEHGSLMKIDTMRYVPLGFNTAMETQVLPYMMAYFHKLLVIFKPTISINYSALMFPVFMFLLTVIAFFLMTRKIFEDNKYRDIIAFISSAFLILSPSLLSRTIAGIPEKESAGFFFLFISFYFFLSSWKSETYKKGIFFAFLAGVSTLLMALIWGGSIYIFVTIALFTSLNFIFGKIDNKRFVFYLVWFIVSILSLPLFTERFNLMSLIGSHSSGLNMMVLFLVLIEFLIFKTKIKELSFVKKAGQKLPEKVLVFLVFIIFMVVLSIIFLGPFFILDFIKELVSQLTQPYTDRLSFTVAENRQPYFSEWGSSFGPMVKNQPLFFWLFFFGSILLVYETFKEFRKKEKYILLSSYVLFIFLLIFSRYSPEGVMNGASRISLLFYLLSFLVLLFSFIYVFYSYNKENKLEELKKINFSYLFLLSFFIPGVIGARSAVRLIMGLAPSVSILVGFFSVAVVEKALEQKEETKKIVAWGVVGIVIFASAYSFYFYYVGINAAAAGFAPSSYTQQWQNAMAWVRQNTPEDAVFSHWWDYGYWIQSIGNRATVLDGGNAIGYWNHLISRYVLTGPDEEGALEWLYTHNVSYLLIDSTDIGKYPAYSNIGSDENYDRYSWIPTFELNSQMTQELKNEIVYFYPGSFSLDQDFIYKNNESQIIFPAGKSGIGGIKISFEKGGGIKNAEAVFVYKGQYSIPLNCVYYNQKIYNLSENGYDGCFYIVQRVEQDGRNINPLGAGIFIGERVKKTNFARLFFLKQEKNFELVHSEDDFVVAALKAQKAISEKEDFVYYYGIRGPIKIWKVNYPVDVKTKPEYLELNFPQENLWVVKK